MSIVFGVKAISVACMCWCRSGDGIPNDKWMCDTSTLSPQVFGRHCASLLFLCITLPVLYVHLLNSVKWTAVRLVLTTSPCHFAVGVWMLTLHADKLLHHPLTPTMQSGMGMYIYSICSGKVTQTETHWFVGIEAVFNVLHCLWTLYRHCILG